MFQRPSPAQSVPLDDMLDVAPSSVGEHPASSAAAAGANQAVATQLYPQRRSNPPRKRAKRSKDSDSDGDYNPDDEALVAASADSDGDYNPDGEARVAASASAPEVPLSKQERNKISAKAYRGRKKEEKIADKALIADQQAKIANQDEQIAAQEQQIVAQEQQIAAQGQQIVAQGQQIVAQGQQIAASRLQAGKDQARIQALDDQVNFLRRLLERQQHAPAAAAAQSDFDFGASPFSPPAAAARSYLSYPLSPPRRLLEDVFPRQQAPAPQPELGDDSVQPEFLAVPQRG